VAKALPDTVRLTDEELCKMIESATKSKPSENDNNDDDDDDENDAPKDENVASGSVSVEAKYHLENYDDEEDDSKNDEDGALSMAALSFYASNQQDPYIAKDEPDSDDEDMKISPTDNLIVLGKVNGGDYFSLEVWVNNVSDGSLYCHHDAILAECPLAIEWVGYDPGEASAGNLVAVGSMSPDIELWDLDVVNSLEPAFMLSGEPKKKKKKVKKAKTSPVGHTDAVLGLSWNRNRGQILASASADESAGVWDLTSGSVVSFFTKHEEKVQAVQWHPVEDQLLVTGCYDGNVRLFDCRAPSAEPSRKWSLGGEIEKVLWNHHNPFYLFAGTEGGLLACLDVRSPDPVFTLSAHTAALTTLALSSTLPSCLITASDDELLKVWDIGTSLTAENPPTLVTERSYKIGAVHCGGSCPNEPLLVCVGGDREMKVINLKSDTKVAKHFGFDKPLDGVTTSDSVQEPSVSTQDSSETKKKKTNRPKNKLSKKQTKP